MSEAVVETPAAEPVAAPEPVAVVTEAVSAPAEQTSVPATTPSWRDGLPDDLRAHPGLEKYSDVSALAKGFLSQSELVGRKGVLLPKEGDAVDLARFHSELPGYVESPEAYDLDGFSPPEGLPWSDNVQTSMLSAMHEAGLTNGQVNSVLQSYAESQSTELGVMQQTIADATVAGEKALRAEFGASYDAKMAQATQAFALATGDKKEEIENLVMGDGTRFGDNPALVRMFAKLGEALGEDSLRGDGGSGSTQTFTRSPSQAQAELNALANDTGHQAALHDPENPEHARAVDRQDALYKQIYIDPETP